MLDTQRNTSSTQCIVVLSFTDLLNGYAEIIGDMLHPDSVDLDHFEDVPLVDTPQHRQQAALLLERLATDNGLDLRGEPLELIKLLRETLTEYYANAYRIRHANLNEIALTVPGYAEHLTEPRSKLLAALAYQMQHKDINAITHLQHTEVNPAEIH